MLSRIWRKTVLTLSLHFAPSLHFVPGLQSALSTYRTGIPIHAILPIFHLEIMSKRGLPGVSFSSFPGAKQCLAAVSGLIGLIAMWWFKKMITRPQKRLQVDPAPHLTCSNITGISRQWISNRSKHPDTLIDNFSMRPGSSFAHIISSNIFRFV